MPQKPQHPAAVMFDLDGTLVDTLDNITAATNHMLSRTATDAPVLDRAAVRRMIGHGVDHLVKAAIASLGSSPTDADIQTGSQHIHDYYATHGLDAVKPYDGIVPLLETLSAHAVPMQILSNKPDTAAKHLANHLFGDSRFTQVTGQRQNVPPKPDPTAALALIRESNIPPEHWIYVGDSQVDVQTGRAAGMFTVAVAWGFRDEAELLAESPDAYIRHPEDLLAFALPPSTSASDSASAPDSASASTST